MTTRAPVPARRVRPSQLSGDATVSVVITCFNYAGYLAAAAQSALDQAGVDVEVIIVDDASTDDSLAIASDLATRDRRVRVVAHPTNQGAVVAFNRGLAEARGEFVVRLDADDLLTPGALARAAAAFQALPAVGLVYGHPLHFSGERLPKPRLSTKSWTLWPGSSWLAARCQAANNVITSPEVMLRRSVLTQVGGMRPLAHTHDMELWLRMAAHADVVYLKGADQAWHREHPGSLSAQAADPLVILADHKLAFDALFDALGPEFEPLRAVARHRIAQDALVQARRLVDRGQHDPAVARLTAFAVRCDPDLTSAEAARRVGWGQASWLVRATGLTRRAGRWAGFQVRRQRWHRSGVYEPFAVAGRRWHR